MTDDLDVRLRNSFSAVRLPSAPPSLERTLAELSIEPRAGLRKRRWALIAVPLGALLLVGSVGTILLMGQGGTGATAPALTPQPTASSPESQSPSPESIDGLHLFNVSDLKKAMSGPDRPAGRIALAGFWTDRRFGHSCMPRQHSGTNLEIDCQDGEYGITEFNESVDFPGPMLTPWLSDDLWQAVSVVPLASRRQYPPIPIVVIGHIDDPRAAECDDFFRRTCLDRFVIDEIVSFDPSSVPIPTNDTTRVPEPIGIDR